MAQSNFLINVQGEKSFNLVFIKCTFILKNQSTTYSLNDIFVSSKMILVYCAKLWIEKKEVKKGEEDLGFLFENQRHVACVEKVVLRKGLPCFS